MKNYSNLHVNLSNCDSEPIHLIGQVQPHGFLIVLSNSAFVVEQVSDNIRHYLGVAPEQVLGKTLAALSKPDEYTHLKWQLQNANLMNPQLLILQGQQFFGFVHESEDKIILEVEPYTPTADQERLKQNYLYSQFQSELNSLESLEEQAQLLMKFVQQLLDYDRVMLYVFDQEWNGEVIAEKIKPGVRSYLYHHFPSTDIPAPARALLEKKHVRQIPDVLATAVPIIPYFNPTTGAPSNIIQSELRNPSEIHLEYLQNMGAGATLSISIIVRDKLWGLITCHNEAPVFINYWIRQSCNLMAKSFANAVLASQEKRDLGTLGKYKAIEEALMAQVDVAGELGESLCGQQQTLLDLTEASGAAIFIQNKFYTVRHVPNKAQLRELVDWLAAHSSDRIFHTRALSKQFAPAAAYNAVASGLLALEISRYNKEYILYFKPEIRETRIWAGNPEKPVSTGPDQRIHPRKSFEKWEEVVKGKSLPWKANELEIAQVLLKDVIAILLRNQAAQLDTLNQELQATAEELRHKNSRLEDFAHIISHNLRSPMSNIQGLYALYQAEPDSGPEVLDRISKVTDNMSATVDDLNQILRTTIEPQLPQQAVAIAGIIEKEKQNLEAIITQTQANIRTELLAPSITMPKIYLESILHNLLSNALKYRSDSRKPEINIRTWHDHNRFNLSVNDNGLGMDLQKVGEKVFGLYKTFHRNKDSKGFGLYLTRMQVASLGGNISVESKPDKGTTFTVTFDMAQMYKSHDKTE
ncbi:ATP-binding protein [Pontibacter chitinilyticus]|uniref:ATP-binding protein n=1 Tax=Pontibacter chitinilyticus TaxID=2674989 RepID=UPI00321BE032